MKIARQFCHNFTVITRVLKSLLCIYCLVNRHANINCLFYQRNSVSIKNVEIWCYPKSK